MTRTAFEWLEICRSTWTEGSRLLMDSSRSEATSTPGVDHEVRARQPDLSS
jgi:hypothetical protein